MKVTQILNNNKISNSNRYNLEIPLEASDIEINQIDPVKKNLSNLTPKAIPYKSQQSIEAGEVLKKHCDNENEKTLRRNEVKSSKHSSSDFDEEEEMPDAKDFEEFDYAEKSKSSTTSMQLKV